MSPAALIAIIIGVAIVLFVWNKLPAVVVAMLLCLSLWASGILTLSAAFAGFGDPAVIFIATLFVVGSALEVTGVTAWAGQHLIRSAGEESRVRLLLPMLGLAALMAALIGVNGAVAALIPVAVVIAVRLKRRSSQLLLPLVFAAHSGSMLMLTGTPVNVLVSEASVDAGVGSFGLFEFALVGIPLAAGSLAIILLFGERLLPTRNGATVPADFSRHARTLVEQYGLQSGIHRARIRATSPLVESAPSTIDIAEYGDLQLLAVQEGDTAQPIRRPRVAENDHVLLRGHPEAVAKFAADMHLSFREAQSRSAGDGDVLFGRHSGLAEVVIPPRSGLIGQHVFPGMVTESGDLIILAVQRTGTRVDKDEPRERATTLRAGDTMLLQGTWKALDARLDDPDVLLVSSPDLVRRQIIPMGPGAKKAIAILAGMSLLLVSGIVPASVAGMLAAGAVVLSGILSAEQAYRAIGWTTVILVAAMKPLATAMMETGAAQLMARQLVDVIGEAGPTAVLAALFLLTALLGQLISNTATALIMIPIGVAAAAGMGISPRPVLMSVAVGAAAAFLSPIASPANAMVMGPGGYAFNDYWRLGLPLLVWFLVVSVFVVPLIWPF